MKKYSPIFLLLCAVGLGLLLAACNPQAAPTTVATPVPCPTCPEAPACQEPEVCPECPEPEVCLSSVEAPYEALWMTSAHADSSAEAFVHWDEDDPAVVPISCAKCHSSDGYQDFLGADGTEAGTVDNDAELGSVITCVTCHNSGTAELTSVVFPSGAEITGLGDEARCMQCHQGRASSASVDAAIEGAGLTDMDTASEDLGFTNIHYFAAAATQFGTQAMGGYQYAGNAYDAKFAHVADMDTCVDCHDPHTLKVKVDTCAGCHSSVASVEDLRDIRTMGSKVDYDGDGDVEEGVYYEIEGLQAMLVAAMQSYAKDVNKTAIGYESHSYPYFFVDGNDDGAIDEEEAVRDNGYNAWTGRLAKAAYNYQTSLKDPGAFAHGGKYIIELLYDSIDDLNIALSNPVSLDTANRIDAGHFASSQEAFRHWDADGEVSGSCARCHSDSGLPTYLEEGVNISAPLSSGFRCATCHDTETYERYIVESVRFPNGALLSTGNADSNLCINCHQGRESKLSVDSAVADLNPDVVSEDLGFINIHYFAAGATLFGSDSQGAYQYDGKEYAGQLTHVPGFTSCVDCHDGHGLTVKTESCAQCHGTEDFEAIRISDVDYDGDGDATEGLVDEITTLNEALYSTMLVYATDVLDAPIVYDTHAYPYFFNDTNGNGAPDPDEVVRTNGFSSWSPRLLKAAYNFQYTAKDPGAFAHNGAYIIQVLYDSIDDLGTNVAVDMASMVRP